MKPPLQILWRIQRRRPGRPPLVLTVTLAVIVGLAAVWTFTPASTLLDVQATVAAMRSWAVGSMAAPIVAGLFVLATLMMIPITVSVTVVALVLGSVKGVVLSVLAAALAGTVFFLIGRAAGADVVARLQGRGFTRIRRQIARHGTLTVALLCVMPLMPFQLMSLTAGACSIRLLAYLRGLSIGLWPVIITLVLFGDQLQRLLADPSWEQLAILALAGGLVLGMGWLVQTWLHRRHQAADGGLEDWEETAVGAAPRLPPSDEDGSNDR